MDQNNILRKNLLELLSGEHARMPFEGVIKEFPIGSINDKFPNSEYTFWDLLEHIRIAQEDILDFIKNPNYQERKWPDDYWPGKGQKANAGNWEKSVNSFKRDFKELEAMVKNPETDLFKEIPWGEGQTFLREIVTVSNHNAFHLGELAIMRQTMGNWDKNHKP